MLHLKENDTFSREERRQGVCMMITKRVGIAVWVRSKKQIRQLRKYGVIHHVSKRFNYVILYCNQDDAEKTVKQLRLLPFIEKVELSKKPEVKTEFKKPLHPRERFDYNIGI